MSFLRIQYTLIIIVPQMPKKMLIDLNQKRSISVKILENIELFFRIFVKHLINNLQIVYDVILKEISKGKKVSATIFNYTCV